MLKLFLVSIAYQKEKVTSAHEGSDVNMNFIIYHLFILN